MVKTTAIYDGVVLRPDMPLEIEPNRRYVITVQAVDELLSDNDAWTILESCTGSIEAPADWSSEHDHYLYGTPKQNAQNET